MTLPQLIDFNIEPLFKCLNYHCQPKCKMVTSAIQMRNVVLTNLISNHQIYSIIKYDTKNDTNLYLNLLKMGLKFHDYANADNIRLIHSVIIQPLLLFAGNRIGVNNTIIVKIIVDYFNQEIKEKGGGNFNKFFQYYHGSQLFVEMKGTIMETMARLETFLGGFVWFFFVCVYFLPSFCFK